MDTYFLFSPSFVRILEDTMDWYDHVAFSFLTFKSGDELAAIKWMQQLIQLHEQGDPEWRRVAISMAIESSGMDPNAVMEALFRLKQWKFLMQIGFSISLPTEQVLTGHICSLRSGLFGIIDQLSYENAAKLVASMGNSEDQVTEIAAIKWIVNGMVSSADCSKLTVALIDLGRFDLAHLSLQLQESVSHIGIDWDNLINKSTPSPTKHQLSTINGFCLIVHQKHFYQEQDPILRQMVENDISICDGSEIDCQRLRDTFVSLGYKVEVVENLTNFQLKRKILDVSQQTDWKLHNGLTLCFISHCTKGRILGCNSVSISFQKDVGKHFNESHCPDLRGKRKMVIFATPFYAPGEVPTLMLDPSSTQHENFIVVWPTTYVLKRYGGSEFISELCSELKVLHAKTGQQCIQTAINFINSRCTEHVKRHKIWSIQQWNM